MNVDYSKTDAIGGGAMCGMGDGDEGDPCDKGTHQYEWVTQPGSVNGPAEHFKICKVCGMEEPGSDVE